MKEITKKSRSRRSSVAHDVYKNYGTNVRITYRRPSKLNDEKRWGKEMAIALDNVKVTLNGRAIQSIKTVLKAAGEID